MCKKNASAHTPFERMCPILANDAKIFGQDDGQDDGYDDCFVGVDELSHCQEMDVYKAPPSLSILPTSAMQRGATKALCQSWPAVNLQPVCFPSRGDRCHWFLPRVSYNAENVIFSPKFKNSKMKSNRPDPESEDLVFRCPTYGALFPLGISSKW